VEGGVVASQAALGVSHHLPVGFKQVANNTTEGNRKHCLGTRLVVCYLDMLLNQGMGTRCFRA